MKPLAKFALLAAIAGVVAVSAATPSDAHWTRHDHRHHVSVHHGHGAYAYAPRRRWNGGVRAGQSCMGSPASPNFVPCLNRP